MPVPICRSSTSFSTNFTREYSCEYADMASNGERIRIIWNQIS